MTSWLKCSPEGNDAIAVGVQYPEDLLEVLLGGAVGHDVHDHHELGEAGGQFNRRLLA